MGIAKVGKVLLGIALALVAIVVLAALGLKLVNWNEHRDTVINLAERFTDYEVERLGHLDIELYFPTRVRLEDFSIKQTAPGSSLESVAGEMVDVEFAPLSLLGERLHIHDLEAQGLQVEMAPPEEPSVDDEPFSIPLLESVQVSDSDIVYRMRDPNADPYVLHIDRFELAQQGDDSPLTLVGSGELLELPVKVDGSMAPIAELTDSDPGMVRVNGQVAGDSFSVDGEASLAGSEGSFEGSFAIEGDHLARLIGPFREVETLPSYSLRTQLYLGPERVALVGLSARLGESEVSGEAGVEFEGDIPHLRADLTLPTLRHQDYAPLVPIEEVVEPEEKQAIFSRDPLDSSALRRLHADVELRVEEYQGASAAELFSDLSVAAKLRDGKLIVNPFEAAVGNGKLAGELMVDNRDDTTALQGKLAAEAADVPVLLAPFLDDVDPHEYFKGNMFATAEFKTEGVSPYDMARALDGGIAVAMEDGSISELVVEALGLNATGTAMAWLRDNPLTEINCLVGVFDIDDGVLRTEHFLISTPTANLVADGTLNLHEETIDFTLKSNSKDLNVVAAGSPIGIEGPLDDISIDVLSGELAARLAGSALLAAVSPVLALLPVMETGEATPRSCRSLETELSGIEEASDQVVEQNDAGEER